MKVDIISAERIVYSDEVDVIIVPGVEGYLGILPHHAPMITAIKPGDITIRKDGAETILSVSGGFIEVMDNKVTVLADE
jgi:F-type H+-transporting ATPase subunit epsilon